MYSLDLDLHFLLYDKQFLFSIVCVKLSAAIIKYVIDCITLMFHNLHQESMKCRFGIPISGPI